MMVPWGVGINHHATKPKRVQASMMTTHLCGGEEATDFSTWYPRIPSASIVRGRSVVGVQQGTPRLPVDPSYVEVVEL